MLLRAIRLVWPTSKKVISLFRYWEPTTGFGSPPRGLVYISHGFSEHLGNYHSLGNALARAGFLAFGHDHVGHGKSEGTRSYVENVDDFVEDIIDHCEVNLFT